MIDLNNEACVYWIHLPEHKNIVSEGYVGVSIDPKRRFNQHKKRKVNPHLQHAFDKYHNIVITVIDEGTKEYCYEKEHKLRPQKNIGWNINEGGGLPPDNRGRTHSEDHNRKIAESNRRRIVSEETRKKIRENNRRRKYSEATILKMSISAKNRPHRSGKPHTLETKIKISQNRKGKMCGEDNPMYGKTHSVEARRKISEARKR